MPTEVSEAEDDDSLTYKDVAPSPQRRLKVKARLSSPETVPAMARALSPVLDDESPRRKKRKIESRRSSPGPPGTLLSVFGNEAKKGLAKPKAQSSQRLTRRSKLPDASSSTSTPDETTPVKRRRKEEPPVARVSSRSSKLASPGSTSAVCSGMAVRRSARTRNVPAMVDTTRSGKRPETPPEDSGGGTTVGAAVESEENGLVTGSAIPQSVVTAIRDGESANEEVPQSGSVGDDSAMAQEAPETSDESSSKGCSENVPDEEKALSAVGTESFVKEPSEKQSGMVASKNLTKDEAISQADEDAKESLLCDQAMEPSIITASNEPKQVDVDPQAAVGAEESLMGNQAEDAVKEGLVKEPDKLEPQAADEAQCATGVVREKPSEVAAESHPAGTKAIAEGTGAVLDDQACDGSFVDARQSLSESEDTGAAEPDDVRCDDPKPAASSTTGATEHTAPNVAGSLHSVTRHCSLVVKATCVETSADVTSANPIDVAEVTAVGSSEEDNSTEDEVRLQDDRLASATTMVPEGESLRTTPEDSPFNEGTTSAGEAVAASSQLRKGKDDGETAMLRTDMNSGVEASTGVEARTLSKRVGYCSSRPGTRRSSATRIEIGASVAASATSTARSSERSSGKMVQVVEIPDERGTHCHAANEIAVELHDIYTGQQTSTMPIEVNDSSIDAPQVDAANDSVRRGPKRSCKSDLGNGGISTICYESDVGVQEPHDDAQSDGSLLDGDRDRPGDLDTDVHPVVWDDVSPSDRVRRSGISAVDVPKGMGKVLSHPGYRRFRSTLEKYLPLYCEDRATAIDRVFEEHTINESRFVQPSSNGQWHEMLESDAREKISKGLNDRYRHGNYPLTRVAPSQSRPKLRYFVDRNECFVDETSFLYYDPPRPEDKRASYEEAICELRSLPPPRSPPVSPSDRWSWCDDTRVMTLEIASGGSVTPLDSVFLAQVMQRDDLTVVVSGLCDSLDERIWSSDFIRERYGHLRCSTIRRFQRKTSVDPYVESKGLLDMFLRDFIDFNKARHRLGNRVESTAPEAPTFQCWSEGELVELDITRDALYLIDGDLARMIPRLYRDFTESFKMPELLPGGGWCMMRDVSCDV